MKCMILHGSVLASMDILLDFLSCKDAAQLMATNKSALSRVKDFAQRRVLALVPSSCESLPLSQTGVNWLRVWDYSLPFQACHASGSILQIDVHEFMCLQDASVVLHPRFNVWSSRNGQGGSAFFRAVWFGLVGVPRVNTKRLRAILMRLKRKNSPTNSTFVRIRLANHGLFGRKAFRPSLYGSSVVVERVIDAAGTLRTQCFADNGALITSCDSEVACLMKEIGIPSIGCVPCQRPESDEFEWFVCPYKPIPTAQVQDSFAKLLGLADVNAARTVMEDCFKVVMKAGDDGATQSASQDVAIVDADIAWCALTEACNTQFICVRPHPKDFRRKQPDGFLSSKSCHKQVLLHGSELFPGNPFETKSEVVNLYLEFEALERPLRSENNGYRPWFQLLSENNGSVFTVFSVNGTTISSHRATIGM